MNPSINQKVCVLTLIACSFLVLAVPANSQVILSNIVYSNNFEGVGSVLSDGQSASGWGTGFDGTAFSYRLNPAATGPSSAWLNPVPAELGTTFAMLSQGGAVTNNTGATFSNGLTYTLTFTHFRRDDTAGGAVTAIIGTNSTSVLISNVFDAVTNTDTFVTRSLTFTNNNSLNTGQAIYLRFVGQSGPTLNSFQAGIDNIVLTAVPEPSTLALFAVASVAFLLVRRRIRHRL